MNRTSLPVELEPRALCLIVFAINQHPDWPFILLANRDEFYDRPTQGLHFWPDAPIIAGRDIKALGSWMGFSRSGRFAALTNYRDGTRSDSGPSRGQLVTDFLTHTSPAAHYQPPAEVRSGYNLLRADRSGIFYSGNRGAALQPLSSGLYTLSNALLDTPWPKAQRARAALSRALSDRSLAPSQLLALLHDDTRADDRELPDTGIPIDKERLLSSCFIHSGDYGTRATTLVMQNSEGDTRMIERRFGQGGNYSGETDLTLRLPPLGL
ncbi:NRDE family protein [Marinobacterium sp. YM272]|uniref:NRDE family protein n=1 Tax=Marinobacterium sp. YM272 TaxID=3421654 RepID=UPI003D7FA03D